MFFNSEKKAPFDTEQQLADADRLLADIAPLLLNIKRNRAMLLLSSGLGIITEIFFYITGFACFGLTFIMNSIFPFYILGEILHKKIYLTAVTNKGDMDMFHYAVKLLVILIGILLIYIGTLKRAQRKSRAVIQSAATELGKVETYFNHKKEVLGKLMPAKPEVTPNIESSATEPGIPKS